MANIRPKVYRLADWQRIKGNNHIGKRVEAIALRHVGLGAICRVGRGEGVPAILRSREVSWNPAEQKPECILLNAFFPAVVIGYDEERRDLLISKKAVDAGPFERFQQQNRIGDVIEVQVEKVVGEEFIVRLTGGIEGFLPRATVSRDRTTHADMISPWELKQGDYTKAAVRAIDAAAKRISLSVDDAWQQIERATVAELETLRPKLGRGLVRLPRREPDPTLLSPARHSGVPRLNVLLVENVREISGPVAHALSRAGHQVFSATSTAAARAMMPKIRQVDVALLDMQLSGDHGATLLDTLNERYPQARTYMFTGNADSERLPPAEKLAGIIPKPIDISDLVAVVEGRTEIRHTPRAWALDEGVMAFADESQLTERVENLPAAAGRVIDSYLSDLAEPFPGAKSALLAFLKSRNEVRCLRSHDVERGVLNASAKELPFSPVGDVLEEGVVKVVDTNRQLDPRNPQSGDALTRLCRKIGCTHAVGVPVEVEASPVPLALFLFLNDRAGLLTEDAVARMRQHANSLAVTLDRAMTDASLAQHQRAICAGSLLLGMTHELRNDMMTLKAQMHVLQNPPQGPGAEQLRTETLADLDGSIRHLEDTFESLLGIARRWEAREVPLMDVLREVVHSCRHTAEVGNIAIDLVEPDGLDRFAVPSNMHQVFLNLILNAIHHTRAFRVANGLIRVVPKLNTIAGRPCVEIRVTDNGSGLDWDSRDRVFQMYYTTRKKGSGLGLYVSRLIVENVGGELMVEESHKFFGTTFLVRLPI